MGEMIVVNEIPQHDLDYIKYLLEEQRFKKELKFIDAGAFGQVYRYKNYAIKTYEDEEDGEILHKLQGLDCYLKLFCYMPDEMMVTEFLEDYKDACDYFMGGMKLDPEEIREKIKQIFHETYKRGFSPRDLHAGNIMFNIETKDFKIVDVGKFRKYVRVRGLINNDGYEFLEDTIKYGSDGYEFIKVQRALGIDADWGSQLGTDSDERNEKHQIPIRAIRGINKIYFNIEPDINMDKGIIGMPGHAPKIQGVRGPMPDIDVDIKEFQIQMAKVAKQAAKGIDAMLLDELNKAVKTPKINPCRLNLNQHWALPVVKKQNNFLAHKKIKL